MLPISALNVLKLTSPSNCDSVLLACSHRSLTWWFTLPADFGCMWSNSCYCKASARDKN